MSQPSTRPTLYKGYRFPPAIISHCVWLYYRFGVSLRDVSELMPQRPEADGFVRDLNPSGVIITLTVMSAWGEALKSQTLSIGNTSVGPWIATITGVPAYQRPREALIREVPEVGFRPGLCEASLLSQYSAYAVTVLTVIDSS